MVTDLHGMTKAELTNKLQAKTQLRKIHWYKMDDDTYKGLDHPKPETGDDLYLELSRKVITKKTQGINGRILSTREVVWQLDLIWDGQPIRLLDSANGLWSFAQEQAIVNYNMRLVSFLNDLELE